MTTCSPKIGDRIYKKLPELSKNELIVTIHPSDFITIKEEKIGEIKITDNGLSNDCTLYLNKLRLVESARKAGANLIKITNIKFADKWSSCDRIYANIYKVDNPKKYETQIRWTEQRSLTWYDFKGKPDRLNYPNVLALTHCGFGYQPNVRLFKETEFHVETTFYTGSSWYLPEGKTDYVLRHEQIHFDLAEVYSRKLKKQLIEANVSNTNSSEYIAIFNKLFQDYKERQDSYDYDTKHGTAKASQEKWNATIEIELAKYDLYKNKDF